MNDYGFGKFIYELRTEKGLSQSELGEILGVSNKAVSKWETGEAKPRSGKLALLARTLDVSVEELLSGKRKKSGEDGEQISFAIGMLAREYKRARTELLVFSILFFLAAVILLLIMGLALWTGEVSQTGEISAEWAGVPIVVCGLVHIASEAGVIVSFILTVRRRRLLYASFPGRMAEVSARTHTDPPAKKTGKLALVVFIGVVLTGVAVSTVLYALGLAEGSAVGLAVGVCAFVFAVGNIVFVRLWQKRIDGHMRAHAYEQAARDAKFLLEVWLPDGRSALADVLRLNIAVACFSLRDDGNFRDYLDEITTRRFGFVKSFWKLAAAFAYGDREAFRTEYAAFLSLAEKTERSTAAAAAFYGERARLLFELTEGSAEARQKFLSLSDNPRLRECVEKWPK